MTDRRLTWVDGDILYADDLIDSILADKWIPIVRTEPVVGSTATGVAAHSSTTWSVIMASGAILQTSDSGVTWTSRNTDLDTASFLRICKDDATKAFAVESTAAAETAYTSNSGTTWTTTTAAAMTTSVADMSFPTTNLIVVAGDAAANMIVYSTDQGATWNNSATQPTLAIRCVDMFNGTTGYAVDSSGNIWKTTDGAVNWTDTGNNTTASTPEPTSSLLAISATIVLFNMDGQIEYYDDGAGTSTVKFNYGGVATLGFVQTTNGDIYGASVATGTYLHRSTDSGVTWSSFLHLASGAGDTDTVYKCALDEYTTNHLLLGGQPFLQQIYNPD